MRPFLTALAVTLLLSLPAAVYAQEYITPETFINITGDQRLANEINAYNQQQQQINSHPSTLTNWYDKSSSSAASSVSASSDAGADGGTAAGGGDQADTTGGDTAATIDTTQTLESTALHSGAPLAGTGPAEDLTIGAVLFAVGLTLYRVRRMEKSL